MVRTQLLGASKEVLLIRQDVVEDKEPGGDGIALSSSSTTLPLLTKRAAKVQGRTWIGLHNVSTEFFQKVNCQLNIMERLAMNRMRSSQNDNCLRKYL